MYFKIYSVQLIMELTDTNLNCENLHTYSMSNLEEYSS